jgi:hypothetical protein
MPSPERALTERDKPVRYNREVGTRQADFLFELIDYAGIFPPAALESLVSAENYSNLLDSDNQWIVGNRTQRTQLVTCRYRPKLNGLGILEKRQSPRRKRN